MQGLSLSDGWDVGLWVFLLRGQAPGMTENSEGAVCMDVLFLFFFFFDLEVGRTAIHGLL